MTYVETYQLWLKKAIEDIDVVNELLSIKDDDKKIEDAFYKDLSFGTGGLRGVIGAGTNRLNIYTIRKITQGLANHLNQKKVNSVVAISYDSRIKSDVFAIEAAKVLAANGIHVFLVKELMPVPFLSYVTRYLSCDAGIMITASHNPSKYNGYKVYGSDGNQITLEDAKSILSKINENDEFDSPIVMDFEKAKNDGYIKYIDEEIIQSYIKSTLRLTIIGNEGEKDCKIVYSPLNGSGLRCVLDVLKADGFNNIIVVPEQAKPDGNFPTCPKPNPEVEEAMTLGIELCKRVDADMLLATDPDCDRVGIAVKKDKDFILLNANETGVLLFDFICKSLISKGKMPDNPIVYKTIVTTPMLYEIAKKYGVEVIDKLTGFKFIGEQICLLEHNGEQNRYIFAMEESYGYLSSKDVRDKDGVNACLLIAEMYQYYHDRNINLYDQLINLYKEFGFYHIYQKNFTFEGIEGAKQMKKIMEAVHQNKLVNMIKTPMISYSDYSVSIKVDENGNKTNINLPKSDVMRYNFSDGNSLLIRPSGTEPKIKVYFNIVGKDMENAIMIGKNYEEAINKFIESEK